MSSFVEELTGRLALLESRHLRRRLRLVESPQNPVLILDGKEVLNFSSNDYLGLANDPTLLEAAIRAVEQYGVGAGASRLISGNLAPHGLLEEALAEFKGTEAALAFSSGYATALGAITALVETRDIVILDKLCHASIVDGARLSGAKLRVFKHNDLEDLDRLLRWADSIGGSPRPRILVVTESVFSMDGDVAPLAEMVELKERYGAWLMVDEAHATGLYGVRRRGLAEAMGVAGQVEVQMGTLSKAFGASGGFVAGSRALIDFLINRARPFIFSTAPLPAAAAAAAAAIRFIRSEAGEARCALLWERVEQLRDGCGGALAARDRISRVDTGGPASADVRRLESPIFPFMVGDEDRALRLAGRLLERGVYLPAIRYPTVGRGRARLRITLTAAHREEHVRSLIAHLQEAGEVLTDA